MITLKYSLNLKDLKEYPERLKPALRQMVAEMAYEIQDDMESNAPRLTGALAEGFYVMTKEHNGYAEALARSLALRPDIEALPSIGQPSSDYMSSIGIIAPYWPFQEYGTPNQPAQPFIKPALERAQSRLSQRMSEALGKVAKEAGFKNGRPESE